MCDGDELNGCVTGFDMRLIMRGAREAIYTNDQFTH